MKPPRAVERVREIVRKEFLQLKRDHRLLRIVFISPLMQLMIFGYAVSTDVRHTKLFVVDQDGTRASRELVDAMVAPGYFDLAGRSLRGADLADALDHGRAVVGLEIPPGFERDLDTGEGASVQILVDGTNSNTATVAQGYAERIFQDFVAQRTAAAPEAAIRLEERAWFNPELESRNYNVPGVVGTLVLLVCLLLTALAVVRERELGTLEQLMVTPLTPRELVAGKAIPFGLIGLFDMCLVSTVAVLWFDIPFRGSFPLLFAASLLYVMSGLGAGLFLSTISKTQQEAFMGSFLFFMPTLLLSGFMFPIESMPVLFQWITLGNPVRHYLEIVRGIFLKGAGFDALWPQFLALLLLGVLILGLAAGRLRKRAA